MKFVYSNLKSLLLLSSLFVASIVSAQNCSYVLKVYDSYGDGWNGAALTITKDGVPSVYTLNNISDTGDSAVFQIDVVNGELLQFHYAPGSYEGEVSYKFFDPFGILVYAAGPYPPQGDVFSTSASCNCASINGNSIVVGTVTASSAIVSWNGGGLPGSFILEYGPAGFIPGTGIVLTTSGTADTLTGLNDNVTYEFYLQRDCGNGDNSGQAGPYSFTTLFGTPPTTSCNYSVIMNDSYGDGWNGNQLAVNVNGVTTNYTLSTGFGSTVSIPAYQNFPITFSFITGSFINEVSFHILNSQGDTVYSSVQPLQNGLLFSEVACPTCGAPGNVKTDPSGTSAKVSWTPAPGYNGNYIIEYGSVGFTLGTGTVVTTTGSSVLLTGLQERTYYNYYLKLACAGGDTSYRIGPIAFRTTWINDVGVSAVSSPETGCGLSANETVKVTLKNFGGAPQSLIPFKYSVNNVAAGIPVPLDGYYTGVISNDSTVTIDFETTFDFSLPGDYVIKAWTELENDSDVSNDTTTFVITHVPIIDTLPYFNNFEGWVGGWRVDPASTNSSWEVGQPDGISITAAYSGTNAWTTDRTGSYNIPETSYLVSPCYDFSNFTQNPRIIVALNYNTLYGYDGMWLETSIDGGQSWQKVGAIGSGVNWYNATGYFTQGDFWTGSSNGWIYAQHPLNGLIGHSDCRIRFVFSSNASSFAGNNYDGVAIDNVFLTTPLQKDLAATAAARISTVECGSDQDQLTVTITNFGTQAQQGFNVGYTVDGGTPVVENVGALLILPNSTQNYTFTTPFNSTGGTHQIVTWTSLNPDLASINDTLSTSITTSLPLPLPFKQDFESSGFGVPTGWNTVSFYGNNGHGNTSFVLASNLYTFTTTSNAVTPYFGPINDGDSLTFDYRYTTYASNGANALTLGPNDKLQVQASTDCGQTFTTIYTIDSTNHVPTTAMTNLAIDMSAYAGQSVKLRFLGTWGAGDYWIDIDNVNLIGCPVNFGIQPDVTDAAAQNTTDGAISLTPHYGTSPYEYHWDNGQTSNEISDLAPGIYTVTITDALGCSQVLDVTVGFTTATNEPIAGKIFLAPNPTTGITLLNMNFDKAVDAQVQLINAMGQVIYQVSRPHTTSDQLPLDLNNYADGVYFVRVSAANKTQVLKLVRNR